MFWLLGIVTVFGFSAGIYSLVKQNKVNGILELSLAVLCPLITISFCSLKDTRAFGGTNWEFLVHSATIDGDIWPWIILVLLIAEIIAIVRTLCTMVNTH